MVGVLGLGGGGGETLVEQPFVYGLLEVPLVNE